LTNFTKVASIAAPEMQPLPHRFWTVHLLLMFLGVSGASNGLADELELLIRQVDTAVAEVIRLENPGVSPAKVLNDPISDGGYLRRAYLVLLGRNPSIAEARAFLDRSDRRQLVRELTNSTEFAHQEYRHWTTRLGLAMA